MQLKRAKEIYNRHIGYATHRDYTIDDWFEAKEIVKKNIIKEAKRSKKWELVREWNGLVPIMAK